MPFPFLVLFAALFFITCIKFYVVVKDVYAPLLSHNIIGLDDVDDLRSFGRKGTLNQQRFIDIVFTYDSSVYPSLYQQTVARVMQNHVHAIVGSKETEILVHPRTALPQSIPLMATMFDDALRPYILAEDVEKVIRLHGSKKYKRNYCDFPNNSNPHTCTPISLIVHFPGTHRLLQEYNYSNRHHLVLLETDNTSGEVIHDSRCENSSNRPEEGKGSKATEGSGTKRKKATHGNRHTNGIIFPSANTCFIALDLANATNFSVQDARMLNRSLELVTSCFNKLQMTAVSTIASSAPTASSVLPVQKGKGNLVVGSTCSSGGPSYIVDESCEGGVVDGEVDGTTSAAGMDATRRSDRVESVTHSIPLQLLHGKLATIIRMYGFHENWWLLPQLTQAQFGLFRRLLHILRTLEQIEQREVMTEKENSAEDDDQHQQEQTQRHGAYTSGVRPSTAAATATATAATVQKLQQQQLLVQEALEIEHVLLYASQSAPRSPATLEQLFAVLGPYWVPLAVPMVKAAKLLLLTFS
jgi:hypothetical protein